MAFELALIEPPPLAADIFGSRIELAIRYVRWLTGPGVERGLVGPRETARVWERHVLNCVCISALIAPNSSVLDIGSGAGLPGLVLAIARPDLDVVLVESMLRRTAFLDEVITDLGLSGVTTRRGRAEELRTGGLAADVVTARAVAPMDRLVGWASPLMRETAELVALKGDGVIGEVAQALPALRSAHLVEGRLVSILAGAPGGDATIFQSGLLVEEQGRWDLTAIGGAFQSSARAGAGPAPEASNAERLALAAVFRRAAPAFSRGSRSSDPVV